MIGRKTWREIRLMTIGYVIIIELLLIPAVLLYPDLRIAAGTLEQLMPMEVLRDMMRAIASPDDDYAYRQYMGVQMFFKGINICGIAGAVLLGTSIVARERENGTLEFLLARPLTRTRILMTKFTVIATALVVPIFLTSWSAIPLSWIIEFDLPLWEVTLASIHSSAFVLLFLTFTVLCSVVASSQAHTAFAVGSVTVIEAAIYFIQEVRVGSVFRMSDPWVYGPLLESKYGLVGMFTVYTGWLVLASAVFLGLAVWQFRRAEP